MQTLDIISVNLWQILISLANLAILFFILKKFLFAPVKKMFAQRQRELDERYAAADAAEASANESKAEWESKLSGADAQADAIIAEATDLARLRGDKIVAEARDRADSIIRAAENEAELERKKATGMRKTMAEKTLLMSVKVVYPAPLSRPLTKAFIF